MKKTTRFAALSAAALLSSVPVWASADDDDRDNNRYDHRRDGMQMNADLKQYSTDEMRIMAYGQALRRLGPGVKVSVNETKDGSYLVQLRDAEGNLIREQEFDQYAAPVRGTQQY
ncbi:hypothetical protein [Marinobacter subterrani]|uniref:Peptidase propeptide and YPEB domain n=1 Tax=Marinobacter subterrani TaxID=1658765 RepID=A0A0J7J560_9GAMM|nr:hypothetical protein [Marinobacter subterrani]KMQ73124.1 hypothetical protein Msub_20321 [Marinobacter subterrani]